MRWFQKLSEQLRRWMGSQEVRGKKRNRRLVFERLRARKMLAGIPQNEAWLQGVVEG